MRNKLVGAAALAAAVLASGTASAAELSFYYMNELTQGQGAVIKAAATKAAARAAQAEINGDPALSAKFRAWGIQIKNVILGKKAADGSTVYYIK